MPLIDRKTLLAVNERAYDAYMSILDGKPVADWQLADLILDKTLLSYCEPTSDAVTIYRTTKQSVGIAVDEIVKHFNHKRLESLPL